MKKILVFLLSCIFMFSLMLNGCMIDRSDNMDMRYQGLGTFIVDTIRQQIDRRIPFVPDKRLVGTVSNINDTDIDIELSTDDGTIITAANPNNLFLNIGDEVYVIAIRGQLTNCFIDTYKLKSFNPQSTIIIYVNGSTGNDNTGNGTNLNPYATIQKALDVIPKNLNTCTVEIRVSEFTGNCSIRGFHNGKLFISGISNCIITNTISPTIVYSCEANIYFTGITFNNTDNAIGFERCNNIIISSCTCIQSGTTGFAFNYSKGSFSSTTISNKQLAVSVNFLSWVYISSLTGTGNTKALEVSGIVQKSNTGTTITGTQTTLTGGQIFGS